MHLGYECRAVARSTDEPNGNEEQWRHVKPGKQRPVMQQESLDSERATKYEIDQAPVSSPRLNRTLERLAKPKLVDYISTTPVE